MRNIVVTNVSSHAFPYIHSCSTWKGFYGDNWKKGTNTKEGFLWLFDVHIKNLSNIGLLLPIWLWLRAARRHSVVYRLDAEMEKCDI
jgi:hypothetical protein